MPVVRPDRKLCQSCSYSMARAIDYSQRCGEAGHAAISLVKWEQLQEDAVSHNYSNDAAYAVNITGIQRAYGRTTFVKSPGPTGVKR